jgi:dynein light chain Tctex-type 1
MDEKAEFVVEEVESILRTAIHQCFSDAVKPAAGAPPEEEGKPPKEVMYNPKKVNEWTNTIVLKALNQLLELEKPFKYIISCIIMQKNGAGLNSSASMHWDTAKDGFCKVPWQNGSMHCIVSVFGLSVNVDDPPDDM